MAFAAIMASLGMWAQIDLQLSDTLKARLEGYKQEMAVYDQQLQQLEAEVKVSPEKMEELRPKARAIYDKKAEAELRIVLENQDNLIPVVFIDDLLYSLDYEELKQVCDPQAAYYNHPGMKKARQLLEMMSKRAPGTQYHDMTLKDMEGKEHKLSDWIGHGQYVLIDFWASWCGPCRQEMPNVVTNYVKYHHRGFEIVGISFDQNEKAWKNAVGQLGMLWPQLSDLGGWQSAATQVYGVFSIPASILVDGQGKIVAIDLRGDKLGAKLKEIYGF